MDDESMYKAQEMIGIADVRLTAAAAAFRWEK